jgi:alanyl-tRNA synthetase
MKSNELREKFLEFFRERGHSVIPSASLVPENDPSVLFTTAGMQQFKRYYLFPEEASSARITTYQKCLRVGDIDEVGDESHLTFFEMLGNFSFGYPDKGESYFKEEAISYAWEFLVEVLKINKSRIHATYFAGEKNIPEDTVSREILQSIHDLKEIKPQGFEDNFWSLGTEGSPGGPTVEFYVDGIEVWNLVFNQFVLKNGEYIESDQKGVDTGMGLERLIAVMQNESDVYKADLFKPIINKLEELSEKKYRGNEKVFRIIADHIKAAFFTIGDGVAPSNKDRGYITRRLIRRALVHFYLLVGKIDNVSNNLFPIIKKIYGDVYDLSEENILDILNDEEVKYGGVLVKGIELVEGEMSSDKFFNLYQSHGLHPELILELMEKKGYEPTDQDKSDYLKEFGNRLTHHQNLSRTASAGMFKGGLVDNRAETMRLHTAAHLLLAALRKALSPNVNQKGSNITEERLRFDFNWPEKLSPEQISEVEKIVNKKVAEDLPVKMEEMSLEEAKKSGATGVFNDRYGEKVTIYSIDKFSREICGGPHVKRTGELGRFKIIKEESSSAGVRRIKAILE